MDLIKVKGKRCQECGASAYTRLDLAGGNTHLCDNCMTKLIVRAEDVICRGVYSNSEERVGEE